MTTRPSLRRGHRPECCENEQQMHSQRQQTDQAGAYHLDDCRSRPDPPLTRRASSGQRDRTDDAEITRLEDQARAN